jgi:hypothetical protein
MTSIHCMCVIPRRCHSCSTMSLRRCCCTGVVAPCSCSAGLHRLYNYTTLRSASVVFIDNVRAGMFPCTRSSKVWTPLLLCCLSTTYIDHGKKIVGKNLFSTANPNSGIRANLCIVVVVRIQRIRDAGVDFLIITLLFAFVHVCGIVGLQAASQTDFMLQREWFHD